MANGKQSEILRRPLGRTPQNDSVGARDPERALMGYIRGRWGALIEDVCQEKAADPQNGGSALHVPPAFLAALIANESGGDETRCPSRFESNIYDKLRYLHDGQITHLGSILRKDVISLDDHGLRGLATSWGLTQILGYHTLRFGITPGDLATPAANLHTALRILGEFAHNFHLDPRIEMAELFACWNTGRPYGKTFDPEYIENGIKRARIYRELEVGLNGVQPGHTQCAPTKA